MNDSIKRISLDIHSNGSKETVNAKRGDTARKLIISLVDGGLPYIISEDCYAVFTAKKPGGNVIYNDCTIKDNTIIYEFTEQTVAKEGRANCEIKLYGANDKLITSPKFTIIVDNNVYNEGDEIESSDEFNALTRLIGEAQQATDDANEAAQKAANTAKSLMVVGKAAGPVINLDDAIKQNLVSCRIFGKTIQDGTPAPENPVELVSVGSGGSITVNVTGEGEAQSMTISTPNGLSGIPVTSDNDTYADEIDLARGVRVHRTKTFNLYDYFQTYCTKVDNTNFSADVLRFDFTSAFDCKALTKVMCNRFPYLDAHGNNLSSNRSRECVSSHSSGDAISVFINKNRLASPTKDGFGEYLYSNETIVQCVINTPFEIPLSEEELAAYAALYTYRDNTTVSNDAGAYMELEYVMDAKKYIDSLMAGNIPQSTGIILPATVE